MQRSRKHNLRGESYKLTECDFVKNSPYPFFCFYSVSHDFQYLFLAKLLPYHYVAFEKGSFSKYLLKTRFFAVAVTELA